MKQEKIEPDYASTQETASFWRDTIPLALHAAADWLTQEGIVDTEDIDLCKIAYREDIDSWGVTIPFSFANGRTLITNKRRKFE